MPDVDAVVVGSGPNGLAAAIVLAQAGLVGARARGRRHGGRRRALGRADAAGIRARRLLGDPPARGGVAVLPHAAARGARRRVDRAAGGARAPVRRRNRGRCSSARRRRPRAGSARTRRAGGGSSRRSSATAEPLLEDLLGPLHVPGASARAGPLRRCAPRLRRRRSPGSRFAARRHAALFAGLAAHSMLPLDRPPSAAFGLMLGLLGHAVGWPLPARRLAANLRRARLVPALARRRDRDGTARRVARRARRDAAPCSST